MFRDDLIVRMAPVEPAWQEGWPELAEREGVGAAVRAAGELAAGVPGARDVGVFRHPPYLRPPGHRRAFYLELEGGVLAIKGSEPLALNFSAFVGEMAAARVHLECRLGTAARDRLITRAELSALEKFPLFEGKVPGCVTLREALAEARAALAVQRAHIARHGGPARLPLPLFVGRWPDSVGDRVLEELRPRLRGRAWEVVESSVRAGLGVYVYHYPAVPIRLAQLPVADAAQGGDVRKRLAALAPHLDPRQVLDGWLGLTARLLALGFVPKDPATLVTGDCLQVQNAVLDGGFADAESLVEASLLDDRALRDAIRRTVHELAITATRLLVGLWVSTVDLRDRLPDVYTLVWNDLAARLDAERPANERIAAILLGRRPAADALIELFEQAL